MFYDYHQNNSGGSFVYDAECGISVDVIIEANNVGEANIRAEGIGLYWDGCENHIDCDCCGDRWYRAFHSEGSDVPSIYDTPVSELEVSEFYTPWVGNGHDIFIHYLDGRIEGADPKGKKVKSKNELIDGSY